MNVPNVAPLGRWMLLELEPVPPKSSVLVVIEDAPSHAQWAKVLRVGPLVRDVTPDSRVCVSTLQGVQIGNGLMLLPETSVLLTGNGNGDHAK